MSHAASLSILFVTRTPWQRDLGAARVFLELAEELRAEGHRVDKFSWEDAFPTSQTVPRSVLPGRLGRVFAALAAGRDFSVRAREHIRQHGNRYDVIDANHTDLAFPKADLRFSGLLVARSVAFVPTYKEFLDWSKARWKDPHPLKSLLNRALFYPQQRQNLRNWPRALGAADLINLSSKYDEEWGRDRLGYGDKVIYFPFGLSEGRALRLAGQAASAAERLAQSRIAFIGTWNLRKGSRDWPLIAGSVLRHLPQAKFRFLGTGMSSEVVLRDFPDALRGSIEVVPQYDSEKLPELLAEATIGAFPGYLESFGFGVLEKLAAGLPVALYDAPGPRDMAQFLETPTTVECGDASQLAAKIVELLTLDLASYERHSRDALRASTHFRWNAIARGTADVYARHLSVPSRQDQR